MDALAVSASPAHRVQSALIGTWRRRVASALVLATVAFSTWLVASAFANWTYKCSGSTCKEILGPQEEIAYNEIIDYTRRSDGGSDNIYACHCHEAALLLASKKMGSEQYKVLTIDSAYYFSSGYFKTSYTDNIAGNEW